MWYLISAIALMTAYLILIGVQKSISDSYYHIKHKYIFTFVLWAFAVLMLFGVIDVIKTAIYPFACFGIVIVGAYSHFKGSKFLKVMHYIGAFTGIGLGVIGLWLEFGYIWLTLSYLLLYAISKYVIKDNDFYWAEVFAIYLIGISLIIIKITLK